MWTEAQGRLRTAPELEAKALFEYLQMLYPEQVQAAQLRTFQRRVRAWWLAHGPAPEVIFPQTHRPGEVLQLDWTHAWELGVTIAGAPLDHLLCQAVLPYSNWQWATRCQSESLLSLGTGLQAALFRLGKAPQVLQTDNSSAATHQISGEGQREFNPEYLSLVAHCGLTPRTIHVDSPNENGDVELHNRHLKRRLEQHLLLRGYRDFASEKAYDEFLAGVLTRANAQRIAKVSEELARMRELPPTRLCDYEELECQFSSHSTIRVRKVAYSVPSRYIGRRLRVRVYEPHLELYHGAEPLGQLPRILGRRAVIDYRHVIEALLRKPGELEYLRLLKLTAELGIGAVEGLLSEWLAPQVGPWRTASLRSILCPTPRWEVAEPTVDLKLYDGLLTPEVAHVG